MFDKVFILVIRYYHHFILEQNQETREILQSAFRLLSKRQEIFHGHSRAPAIEDTVAHEVRKSGKK
jgi:hypothetical protein